MRGVQADSPTTNSRRSGTEWTTARRSSPVHFFEARDVFPRKSAGALRANSEDGASPPERSECPCYGRRRADDGSRRPCRLPALGIAPKAAETNPRPRDAEI